ncbi:hypothetical protein FHS89_002814 [Rubricella aquisinus]|uniref:EcsC protein family protein n=1 Tax=Rubricella aquisinus TaxID=2028108 RepID=A0A840WSX4_9RHOB|nr:EcsC family protein [Rubricella aquisinus]MBB5516772.1 hypothetical protein [Rubricella aquisinus]
MTKPPATRPDLTDAIARVLDEQRAFEEHRATRLGRGAEAITAPLGSVVRQVVPPSAMRQALDAADRVAAATLPDMTHDTRDLPACDAAALRAQAWAMGANAASGAGAGWFGGAGMAVDIPATMTLAARNVRATGMAYGFAANTDDERMFRLTVLELATTSATEARAGAISRINQMARGIGGTVAKEGLDWVVDKAVERIARQLGTDLAQRKAAQIIPIAGAVLGAGINASFQTDVSRAARYAYRQRWLNAQGLLPAPKDEAG